jgi:hypothetical protein
MGVIHLRDRMSWYERDVLWFCLVILMVVILVLFFLVERNVVVARIIMRVSILRNIPIMFLLCVTCSIVCVSLVRDWESQGL